GTKIRARCSAGLVDAAGRLVPEVGLVREPDLDVRAVLAAGGVAGAGRAGRGIQWPVTRSPVESPAVDAGAAGSAASTGRRQDRQGTRALHGPRFAAVRRQTCRGCGR